MDFPNKKDPVGFHVFSSTAQGIIALGWQYLALYILGTEALGQNWARDYFPGPPPNAKTLGTAQRRSLGSGGSPKMLFGCPRKIVKG